MKPASLASLKSFPGFEAVDYRLGEVLASHTETSKELLCFSAMLLNRATRQGHVCLQLPRYAGQSFWEAGADGQALGTSVVPTPDLDSLKLMDVNHWREALLATTVVGEDLPELPLVLSGNRLYLQRYFQHERVLAGRLWERLAVCRNTWDAPTVRESIARWFAGTSEEAKRAAEIAVASRMCVVTGGPGTGKTTTVVRLLGLLTELARIGHQRALRILLLAPTGKAAARLSESIVSSRIFLKEQHPSVVELPAVAMTIHRALAGRERTEHGNRLPLAADLVVVDEASMVDVALMRELFDASCDIERLILLGDPNQLASVQAGAVLGDICAEVKRISTASSGVRGAALPESGGADRALERSQLAGVAVELVTSHRFKGDSGIGRLSACIRQGDVEKTFQILENDDPSVRFLELNGLDFGPLHEEIWQGYEALRAAWDVESALESLNRYRVLCVHRRGRFGVETWNEQLELRFREAESSTRYLSKHSSRRSSWQEHRLPRPILVTLNDENARVFNGDLGVCLVSNTNEEEDTAHAPPRSIGTSTEPLEPRAYFRLGTGQIHSCSLGRLPEYEHAYAMSVHKSQGSETDEVLVVLPEANSPLLTRELLYTAVTRAKLRCVLAGSRLALKQAVKTKVERQSGLGDALASLMSAPHELERG